MKKQSQKNAKAFKNVGFCIMFHSILPIVWWLAAVLIIPKIQAVVSDLSVTLSNPVTVLFGISHFAINYQLIILPLAATLMVLDGMIYFYFSKSRLLSSIWLNLVLVFQIMITALAGVILYMALVNSARGYSKLI